MNRSAQILLASLLAACSASEVDVKWPERQAPETPPQVPQVVKPTPPVAGKAGKQSTPTREGVPTDDGLLRGRSTVTVNAPIAKVRKAVLDFRHYPDFMPHYKAAQVLGRKPNGDREVYMQIGALGGALKMWARVEMAKTDLPAGERYETTFVDGNVRDFKAIWTLKAEGNRTELTLEVFLRPKLPMPKQLLDGENLDGAVKGVAAMRDRIEN